VSVSRWGMGLISAALGVSRVYAQDAEVCTTGGVDQEQFYNLLVGKPADASTAVSEAADSPKTTPNDKQLSAPGTASVSPDVVSAPDFTSLLGLAVDSGLISQTTGATTLNLNFFAFVAAMNQRVVQEQEQYARFTTLRRFSGSVTLGGKGDAIDQDGDGVVDDPKTADKSTDIVTWEVRVRLLGSRDRRDSNNYKRLLDKTSPIGRRIVELNDKQDDQLIQLIGKYRAFYQKLHSGRETQFCKSDVNAFVGTNQAALGEFAARDAAIRQQYDAIAADIDKSLLITAVLGGTERHNDKFGPDKRLYGLRASWAREGMTLDANLDYNQIKSFRGADEQKSVKFGLAYNGTYMRDLVGYKDQGITLTVAAAFEKYHNVPSAAHDKIESANVKLTYPVSQTISLPFSLTWANHADLLQGEREIRGNIGFTYDLSPLLSTPKTM
jgi:hypothetical protein